MLVSGSLNQDSLPTAWHEVEWVSGFWFENRKCNLLLSPVPEYVEPEYVEMSAIRTSQLILMRLVPHLDVYCRNKNNNLNLEIVFEPLGCCLMPILCICSLMKFHPPPQNSLMNQPKTRRPADPGPNLLH